VTYQQRDRKFWADAFRRFGQLYGSQYDRFAVERIRAVAGLSDPDTVATIPARDWDDCSPARVDREGEAPDMTLAEVGEVLGISADRVRGIEGNALSKLRHPSRAKQLSQFTLDGEYMIDRNGRKVAL